MSSPRMRNLIYPFPPPTRSELLLPHGRGFSDRAFAASGDSARNLAETAVRGVPDKEMCRQRRIYKLRALIPSLTGTSRPHRLNPFLPNSASPTFCTFRNALFSLSRFRFRASPTTNENTAAAAQQTAKSGKRKKKLRAEKPPQWLAWMRFRR